MDLPGDAGSVRRMKLLTKRRKKRENTKKNLIFGLYLVAAVLGAPSQGRASLALPHVGHPGLQRAFFFQVGAEDLGLSWIPPQ